MKRVEQCYFKALKTSFVENKGQSGPLSADSKTQGKCQLSVEFSAICQFSVKILAICQLSVNPIQTLLLECLLGISPSGRNPCGGKNACSSKQNEKKNNDNDASTVILAI